MKTGKQTSGFAVGMAASTWRYLGVLSILGFAAFSVSAQIYQSGGSGTTYTDVLGDGQGSSNPGRDLSSVTIANDADNLYITINFNPAFNAATGGSYNYGIGITTGSPTAGGDTSAATDHGNPYGRAISIDSSFGGMTDWIGVFGAGGAGSVASPFTSYGFNDYVYGTPASTSPAGVWTKINTVSSGEPLSSQPSTSIPNSITLTVPLSDFSANFFLTPGTSFDFDIFSTGTSGNQTAYDSLVVQGPIQATYSSTAQYNATILDQYTITAVPEPAALALASLSGLSLWLFRRQRK